VRLTIGGADLDPVVVRGRDRARPRGPGPRTATWNAGSRISPGRPRAYACAAAVTSCAVCAAIPGLLAGEEVLELPLRRCEIRTAKPAGQGGLTGVDQLAGIVPAFEGGNQERPAQRRRSGDELVPRQWSLLQNGAAGSIEAPTAAQVRGAWRSAASAPTLTAW
jgi:hypothetical protein